MTIKSTNPYSASVEAEFEPISLDEINAIINNAHSTFLSWRQTSLDERKRLITRVASILLENKEQYAELMAHEMGKLVKEGAGWEIPNCAEICEFYIEHAEKFLAPTPVEEIKQGTAYIEKKPMGVIFGVMPWNFPFYQVIRFVIPNIIAGNTVVFKHSSNVPRCAIAIQELFKAAGLPNGVVTHLLMHACDAEKVISHPAVQGVSLTGSERAGSSVAAIAGKHLKKCVMELGGSDAFIVTSDTSIPDIIDIALMAKMFNTGQVCTGAKRFIIVKDKYQEFLKEFTQGMAALKAGDPTALETDYAPMVNEQEADALLSIIDQAREQGATVHQGGQRLTIKGAWLEPTILTDITPQMEIYKLELFGPVAMVFCVENEEQAIRLANDTCFGLSSSIMCRNIKHAQELASKLETGVAFINNMTITEPGLPFGGIKKSGFGRELGRAGMEEFINKKLIRIFN